MVTIFPWQFSHENHGQTLVSCPELLPAFCSQHPTSEAGLLRRKPPSLKVPWVEHEGISVLLLRNESKWAVIFTPAAYLGKLTARRGTSRRSSALSTSFTSDSLAVGCETSEPGPHQRAEEEEVSESLGSAAGPNPLHTWPYSPTTEG